ncbi:MAG: RidA family protein [Tissierellales bacterium]|nr:RidA family protein [Tissierellales bacterium]MBN2827158.1 RidA family protein [Tissierellales bacterium]
MKKKVFYSKKCVPPTPSYSQAVIHNGVAYISGQLSLDIEGKIVHGSVEQQTRIILDNVKTLVEELGSTMEDVLSTSFYFADNTVFPEFDKVYRQYFPKNPPARVATISSEIYGGLALEMSAIVAVDEDKIPLDNIIG